MQFEYLTNVEYWCREQELKSRTARARVVREASNTQFDDQRVQPRRRHPLFHLLRIG